MMKYAALLRGINVGGNRLIKMEDLKNMCIMPGLRNVRTYIASGNVIFEAAEMEPVVLEKKFERQLKKCLGYEVRTFIRTFEELQAVVTNNPLPQKEGGMIYIGFLSAAPEKQRQRAVAKMSNENESFDVIDRELYAWVRRGKGHLLFSNSFFEKHLAVQATTRNWNTVNKILQF